MSIIFNRPRQLFISMQNKAFILFTEGIGVFNDVYVLLTFLFIYVCSPTMQWSSFLLWMIIFIKIGLLHQRFLAVVFYTLIQIVVLNLWGSQCQTCIFRIIILILLHSLSVDILVLIPLLGSCTIHYSWGFKQLFLCYRSSNISLSLIWNRCLRPLQHILTLPVVILLKFNHLAPFILSDIRYPVFKEKTWRYLICLEQVILVWLSL